MIEILEKLKYDKYVIHLDNECLDIQIPYLSGFFFKCFEIFLGIINRLPNIAKMSQHLLIKYFNFECTEVDFRFSV